MRRRCIYEDLVMERRREMKRIFTKQWLKAAAIRAIKTCAQTAIATIGTATVVGEVNWPMVFSASCVAAVLSILTSLAGLPEVDG